MQNKPFEIIELKGTPFEIGKTHGQKAKTLIQNSVANYKKMFKDNVGYEWGDVQKMARLFIDPIHTCDPDILEEMKGIAEGSELMLEDIIAVNARTELLYSNSPENSEGCTAVAVMPEKTAGGRILMGQNWDYRPMVHNSLVILKIEQKNKPNIIMMTEAGMVGKIGFNSAGICTGLNALSAPSTPRGIPVHVALRLLLNGENITQGAGFLETMPIAGCGNIIVGSACGEAIHIEIGPDDFDVLYPQNGILVHANNYLSPRFAHFKNAKGQRTVNSYIRQGRMSRIFDEIKRPIILDDLKHAFSDHHDYPDGICRHPDEKKAPSVQAQTLYSVIFDPEKLEMHLACGNPCCTPYEVYTLEGKK